MCTTTPRLKTLFRFLVIISVNTVSIHLSTVLQEIFYISVLEISNSPYRVATVPCEILKLNIDNCFVLK